MTARESVALLIVIGGAFWFGVGWFTLAPNDAKNTFVFLGIAWGLFTYFRSAPRRRNVSTSPSSPKTAAGRPAKRYA